MGTVTNLQTVKGNGGGMDLTPKSAPASGSRTGEDNSKHVAIAIFGLAALAIGAGLVNVKLSAGTGRS